MTTTEANITQSPPTNTLLIGAEVWSPLDDTMARQTATPSIGDLDQRIGSDHTQAICAAVEQSAQDKFPKLITLMKAQATAWVWPVIDREQVTSVVVLYFSTAGEVQAAAELWTGRPGRSELCLADAKYTGLDRFAKLSPYISFPKGSGLPGLVWETNIPQIVEGLGQSSLFMRATGAQSEGLSVGFAIPCIAGSTLQAVSLLLSGTASPLALAYETWLPEQHAGSLRLVKHDGAYVAAPSVAKASKKLSVPAGDTWIGRAWATRKPEVICDSSSQSLQRGGAEADGITSGVAIPIIVLDDVAAVAVFMW